jgi:uncharacterized cupin superfamily protein
MTDETRSTRRHPRVVNLDETTPMPPGKGPRYARVRRQLGAPAGSQALGVSHVELPPGTRSWPFHYHAANEEGLYFLSGRGRVRIGAHEVEVRAGDYVALPVGPDHAHQTINDGDEPLRYLCISTMLPTDVAVYPDSNKFGVFAGSAPGAPEAARFFTGYFRDGERIDYYDGEDTE